MGALVLGLLIIYFLYSRNKDQKDKYKKYAITYFVLWFLSKLGHALK